MSGQTTPVCPVGYCRSTAGQARKSALLTALGGVNLRTLQAVGVINVKRLPFGVELDGGRAGFAVAVAGALGAAESELDFGADGGRIYINDAGLEVPHGAVGPVHIPRVDRSRKAIFHVVGDLDGLIKTIEGKQRHHRAEDFLLSDMHGAIQIGNNRGFMETAAGQFAGVGAMSSDDKPGVLFLSDLDVLDDRLQLRLIDQRADFGPGIEPITDLERAHALREAVEKL